MTLSQLKPNQQAVISSISCDENFSRRFFDLGFICGQKIKCENIALTHSPIAYTICGSKIAIRKCDADKIKVRL